MSKWTHALCDICWLCLHPDRDPVRVKYSPDETCCFCNQPTRQSGIYIRFDPTKAPCKGQGDIHEEEAVDSNTAGEGVLGLG